MSDSPEPATAAPSQDEVLSWFDTLSNWGRWGVDDHLGTLNLVTPAKRARAAALVQDGITVSCAWDIDPAPSPEQVFGPPQRFMVGAGQGLPAEPRGAGAAEWIGMIYHGYTVTHIDGLSHIFWDGRMYNGRPADKVTVAQGATEHAITDLKGGVVTRGVLLDVAGCRGGAWLEPGEGAFPHDLEEAENRQGVRVEEGDAVLLRTGYGRKKRERGPDVVAQTGRAGWHAACLPWLRERGVALVAADTANDVIPSGYPLFRHPLHSVGISAMGLWLVDNCDLEPLAAACSERSRYEFLFVVAPLRVVGGTGSPANPLAIL